MHLASTIYVLILISFHHPHLLHVYTLHSGHLGVWLGLHPHQIHRFKPKAHESVRTSAGPVISKIDSAKASQGSVARSRSALHLVEQLFHILYFSLKFHLYKETVLMNTLKSTAFAAVGLGQVCHHLCGS